MRGVQSPGPALSMSTAPTESTAMVCSVEATARGVLEFVHRTCAEREGQGMFRVLGWRELLLVVLCDAM